MHRISGPPGDGYVRRDSRPPNKVRMSRSTYSSDLRSAEQADGTVPYGAAHPHLVRFQNVAKD